MVKKAYFNSTRIAVIALFGALSGVLYIFNFAIPAAFPSFLELNFSDIPALIGTFTLDPLSGVLVIVVKILIKLIVKSTSTAFVGEFADLLIGSALVLPAGFLYQKKRTFKGALLAMAVGTLASVSVAVLMNWLVLVPFYVQFFFKGSWEPLIGMMTGLFPNCTRETFYNFYLWVSVLPFNLMRCLIAVAVTLIVYKHISRAVNQMNEKLSPPRACGEEAKKLHDAVAVLACLTLLLALAAVALLRVLFA